MKSLFEKPLEKILALGETTFDNLGEIANLHAESAKKLGAAQAELAEGAVEFGGKQFEILGKLGQPAQLIEVGYAASAALRERMGAYTASLRDTGEELFGGYVRLVQRAFEKKEVA